MHESTKGGNLTGKKRFLKENYLFTLQFAMKFRLGNLLAKDVGVSR